MNNKGFTLVELAIVLVIIGVILGGVMKGQQLVASSKSKRIMRDFQTVQTAVYAYQDKIGTLPGSTTAEPSDITADTATPFWQDLRAEALYPGATNSATNPTNVFGGNITPGNTGNSCGLDVNAICFAGVPKENASAIDKSYDDDTTNSGDIRIGNDTSAAIANIAAATGASVVVCIRLE